MQRAVRYLEISPLSLDDKMEGDPNAGPFMKYRRATKCPRWKLVFYTIQRYDHLTDRVCVY